MSIEDIKNCECVSFSTSEPMDNIDSQNGSRREKYAKELVEKKMEKTNLFNENKIK